MDHYLEIRLLPDPEFVPAVLMNALFSKLHRRLAEMKCNTIGISFPDVQQDPPSLGNRLRLHGSSHDLENLTALNWLKGMLDHIAIIEPKSVPQNVQYRNVRRVQAKSNPERLRRRMMKRKGVSEQAARQAIPDSVAERLQLPFVTIRSQSTGQEFRLFISHEVVVNKQVEGEFGCYGLSSTATIPWF